MTPVDLEVIFIAITGPECIRNSGVGDWMEQGNELRIIRALRMDNLMDTYAVAIHEMVEQFLCARDGVSDEVVTAFDAAWDNEDEYDEEGDDPTAPYHAQHLAAKAVERRFVEACGDTWEAYDARVTAAWKAIAVDED